MGSKAVLTQVIEGILAVLQGLRVALFDFDGVIADTEPLHAEAYRQLLSGQGVILEPNAFQSYMGNSEEEIYRALYRDFGVKFDPETAVPRRLSIFRRLLDLHGLKPFLFVRPLLERMRSAHQRAFIVSSQRDYIIQELLDRWALSDYFERILAAPRIGTSKLDLIVHHETSIGLAASELALFEDSPPMLDLARRLGFRTIAVAHMLNSGATLHADFVIQTAELSG